MLRWGEVDVIVAWLAWAGGREHNAAVGRRGDRFDEDALTFLGKMLGHFYASDEVESPVEVYRLLEIRLKYEARRITSPDAVHASFTARGCSTSALNRRQQRTLPTPEVKDRCRCEALDEEF